MVGFFQVVQGTNQFDQRYFASAALAAAICGS